MDNQLKEKFLAKHTGECSLGKNDFPAALAPLPSGTRKAKPKKHSEALCLAYCKLFPCTLSLFLWSHWKSFELIFLNSNSPS
jgi:hypothetical protein